MLRIWSHPKPQALGPWDWSALAFTGLSIGTLPTFVLLALTGNLP